jgi:CubicO group peptidase (beta-lactamase class C family)
MPSDELEDVESWLHEELPSLIEDHRVPGAVVGVLRSNRVVASAAGVLSLRTRQAVTVDSLFQIGSITKVWTATLVMQMVDEGLIDLDDPVRRHLPDFQVADAAVSAAITVRHLLSHTAGFDGELFDERTGDGTLDHYVREVLPGASRLFAPGDMFSYCNGGFSVLGLLLERLRGMPYSQVVQRFLVEPLHATAVAASAEEAITWPVAAGHIGTESAVSRRWSLPACLDPAGGRLAMAVGDLLRFAQAHLQEGTIGGRRVLSPQACAVMRTPQTEKPATVAAFATPGLGWFLLGGAAGVLGADGGTIGQRAFLRLFPERETAVAILANSGTGERLTRPVFAAVLARLGNDDWPPVTSAPKGSSPEPRQVTGRYASSMGTFTVTTIDDRLYLHSEPGALDVICDMSPPSGTLTPTSPGFAITASDGERIGECVFLMSGDRAELLHIGGQAVPRVC